MCNEFMKSQISWFWFSWKHLVKRQRYIFNFEMKKSGNTFGFKYPPLNFCKRIFWWRKCFLKLHIFSLQRRMDRQVLLTIAATAHLVVVLNAMVRFDEILFPLKKEHSSRKKRKSYIIEFYNWKNCLLMKSLF